MRVTLILHIHGARVIATSILFSTAPSNTSRYSEESWSVHLD